MKITVKQLKQLIRENVQEQMQQEGIDEIFGFGKPKGIFDYDKNANKYFADVIGSYAEKALYYSIKNHNVDHNNQRDKEKVITDALESLKKDLPKKPEELASYINWKFPFSSYPEFYEWWNRIRSKTLAQETDKDRIIGIIDNYLVAPRELTRMQTVNTVKESIRAIVREEVKRQLRSNR